MFKKRTFIFILTIFLSGTLLGIRLFYISSGDRSKYNSLLTFSQPTNTQNSGQTQRHQVTKNLWLQGHEKQYQYIVMSENSILHLNQSISKNTKVIEEMNHAVCFLQQKIYFVDELGKEVTDQFKLQNKVFPMQQVCKLKVSSASYAYQSKHFVGDDVEIEFYEMPGHELSVDIPLSKGKKLMEGTCDHIDFNYIQAIPNLKVKNLTAQVFEQEKIK